MSVFIYYQYQWFSDYKAWFSIIFITLLWLILIKEKQRPSSLLHSKHQAFLSAWMDSTNTAMGILLLRRYLSPILNEVGGTRVSEGAWFGLELRLRYWSKKLVSMLPWKYFCHWNGAAIVILLLYL